MYLSIGRDQPTGKTVHSATSTASPPPFRRQYLISIGPVHAVVTSQGEEEEEEQVLLYYTVRFIANSRHHRCHITTSTIIIFIITTLLAKVAVLDLALCVCVYERGLRNLLQARSV